MSLFGSLRFRRAYYLCGSCSHGRCPFDDRMQLLSRGHTLAVERLTCLAGIVADSFDKATHLLEEMAGTRLSESTVESTTEDVGALVSDLLEEGTTFGEAADWDWHCDATGQRVAYVSLDATGVRQQHGQGGKAEGRMAYVGMIYNPMPNEDVVLGESVGGVRRPIKARYLSGLYSLGQMGELLRRQGAQVGMDRADVWVAISDGGAGLENCLRSHFPRVEAVILDYWHAAEYLWDLARTAYTTDAESCETLATEWCRFLKAEGGALMIGLLQQWQPPAARREILEQRDAVIQYFQNHVHRMEYPEYRQRGWQIGSGAVESGCKTVVGARMKGAGMRWSEHGTHAVCQLRALYRSETGQWNAFWNRQWNKSKHLFYQQH